MNSTRKSSRDQFHVLFAPLADRRQRWRSGRIEDLGNRDVKTSRRRRLILVGAAVLSVLLLPADPALAVETTVGQCHFQMNNPHLSSTAAYPTIRVHTEYYCDHTNLIYVNGQVSLRFCGPSKLPASSCPILRTTNRTSTSQTGGIRTGSWSRNWLITDSEPYPEAGWYVATAIYEVCLFNGAATTGNGATPYGYYPGGDSKIKIFEDLLS